MAQECTGAAIWITLAKNAKAKGQHTLSKVPRRKRTRTSYFCKKRRKTFYTTRTSVKAIVSWKKLTSVSDLPGLKHTAQQSPRWHLKRGRERVARVQTKETQVLAPRRPASQLAACKGFRHVGCHL